MTPYYRDESVTLYLGDCREVLPEVDTASVDLLLSDPPYGIGYSPAGGGRGWQSGPGEMTKTFTGHDLVKGDDEPFDPSPLLRFSRVMLFGGNHYADRLPPSPTWIVWDKREGRATNDFADCELIWSNVGGPARLFHHLWNGAFRASEKGQRRVHPTQKPLALMVWLVENFTKPGNLICDPYCGSGTSLVAAKMLGRRAIGIEIEEKYCRIAVERLRQAPLFVAAPPSPTQLAITEAE